MATKLSACVASARWRAGERSRSGGVRSVARRALTLLNAPLDETKGTSRPGGHRHEMQKILT